MGTAATTDTAQVRALMAEIVRLEKVRAGVEAGIETAMAELGALAGEAVDALPADRRGAELPLRDISARLAARLRVSDRTIQNRLGEAQTLLAEYPRLVAAWGEGRISRGHVRAITDAGDGLRDAETRALFEQHLLRVAEEESVARTRPVAERLAERLNPIPLARRHAEARARRRLQLRNLPDAMARLILDVPAVIGRGIYDRVTQLGAIERAQFDGAVLVALAERASMFERAVMLRVRAARPAAVVGGIDLVGDPGDEVPTSGVADAGGQPAGEPRAARGAARPPVEDPRTRDQRRADICAELLLTGVPTGADPEACAQVTAHIRLSVPVLTLVGDDLEAGAAPAELAGHVPVDPATARRLTAAAPGWDRVLTHPITGMVLAVDRYRPTTAQTRYLDARDVHCRFTGCTRPVHECDHDHTVDYARGGPTDVRYLCGECRRHHVLRHGTGWTVIPRADGVFEWIDPDGRHYRDRPPPTVGFLPESFYRAQHRRDGLHRQDGGGPAPF